MSTSRLRLRRGGWLSLTTITATVLAMPALASAATPTLITPACVWRLETTPSTANVAFPDSGATYWTTPFTVQDGLQVTVSGSYADARYTSLTVYDSNRSPFMTNGVSSSLPDYLTAPDAGSINPWQQTAVPGGHFTVTLSPNAATGETNTVPLAPAGTRSGRTGYLIYRAYLPADGNPSSIPLPTLTFDQDGTSVTPPVCGSTLSSDPPTTTTTAAAGATVSSAADSAGPQFARGSSGTGGLFPNPDNAYLSEKLTPPTGNTVLVIRGKAPRTPQSNDPIPWPSATSDIRYWSLCDNLAIPPLPVVVNTLPDGSLDYGCRADYRTRLDVTGYYTFVVGTEAQRSAIENIPGATFVPFSNAHPTAQHILLFRNLLGGEFEESVQNVPSDNRPASAAAVMKDYYPRSALCSLSTLAAEGPQACLRGS
ncbi:hypothetical protein MXD59_21865 [Frankia sp. Ag45/Mut15]|uniref:Secreted protein n=1 Tax=Frankia umida TaxID=573489 RepID=A0ABT0K3J1_9ACTN|nr:hypothetical protein [Frankia umida]MCK9878384.1 hypothetical protein [Frankia umida]